MENYKEPAIRLLTQGGYKREGIEKDFDALVNAFNEVINKDKIGLILIGGVGCGKTISMRALAHRANFIDLADVDSLELLQRHTRFVDGEAVEKWWMMEGDHSIVLDDLGNEPIKNEYGVKIEVVSNFIMKWYADVFKNSHKKARMNITTNLDWAGITARYGDRVSDRLMEMCKPVLLTSQSNRKLA